MNEKQRKLAEEVREIILDYYEEDDDILMISLSVEPRLSRDAPVTILVHPDSIGKFVGKRQIHIAKLISRLPDECFTKMNRTFGHKNTNSNYFGKTQFMNRGRWIHIEGYAQTMKSLSNECSNCGASWENHQTCMKWN